MADPARPPNAADADETRSAEEAPPSEAIGLALLKAKHDLNNLFHVARGWSRMLKHPRSGLDQRQEGIEAVLAAAEQTSELVNGILALSGPLAEGSALCDLTQELTLLARGLRYLLPAPERLRLELASRARVLCNFSDLRRALLSAVLQERELLQNDELLLRTSDASDEAARLEPAVEIELRRVARKPDGLALAEARLLLRFPAEQRTASRALAAHPSRATNANSSPIPEVRGAPTAVLLVDDHREVRRLATTMLERAGYQVLTASDAQEALTTSESYDGPIHVLCCDAHMPGLPSLQLITQLCAARPDLKVLVCTGERPQGKLAEFPCLAKPFSYQQLLCAVRSCLA